MMETTSCNEEFDKFDLAMLQFKICELERNYEKILQENSSQNKEINVLKEELIDSWDAICSLDRDLIQLNQYNRRENIEISGIPDEIGMDQLETVCIDILRRIGVTGLSHYDISACHRLKKENPTQNCSNVIIRFVCRKRVIESFHGRHYLKDNIPEFPNIFIHENLCPRLKSILE